MNTDSLFKNFSLSAARSLPVIILADTSGSMGGYGKIEALNQSVADMLQAFADEDDLRAQIHCAIITFGGTAQVHTPLQEASKIQWSSMHAGGGTPMGEAMRLAADLIEDKEAIPSRAYRPTLILVSDGMPTDEWRTPMQRLNGEGRASKADRMALAIGPDADDSMLREFLNDPERPIYRVDDARRIKQFFDFVTMTVTVRSRSVNPNLIPAMQDPFGLDDF